MKLKQQEWIRFGLYLVILVILNLVSNSLFFRLDLTKNRVFTLSSASRKAVSSLEEPLTIRFFLSEDLPQPNHNLEQEIRDLMGEYSQKANKFFNYEILMLDGKGENTDSKGVLLTDLAAQYGITPVKTQDISDNQLNLVNAYMGMVMLQGDMSEKRVNLGVQDNRDSRVNLEYEITGMIESMAAKTNALLAMKDNISVKLVFSSTLYQLGRGFSSYPDEMRSVVDDLQSEFYQRLSFQHIDPSTVGSQSISSYGLTDFNLESGSDASEDLYAALVIEKGGEFSKVELISRSFLGDSLREPADMREPIQQIANRLLGVQKTIGYLSDHGALALYQNPYQQQQGEALQNFYQLLSSEYQVKEVTLDALPEGLDILVLSGITQTLSDYELYKIDQYLMKGGSLALFMDPFIEQIPQQQNSFFGAQPSYIPFDNRLAELLSHYGMDVSRSYVLDKKSYIARRQLANGNLNEIKFYNAPEIKPENINQDLTFLNNLKGMIFFNAAPLIISDEINENLTIDTLISTSPQAWIMSEDINLNPQMMTPPPEDQMGQFPLALLASGEFTSYFEGKDIPKAPVDEESGAEQSGRILNSSSKSQDLVERGNGQILLIGTSAILKDNILQPTGSAPNSMFILNSFDRLSGREDYAVMRSKGQSYNPINDSLKSGTKTFIKIFNIAVIPVLVILMGLLMWLRWISRRKKIEAMFSEEGKA